MGILLRFGPGWEARLREAGLDRWDALLALPARGGPIAASRTSRTDRVEAAGVDLHRKHYRYPTARDRRRAALRGTLFGRPRARRELDALLALGARGVPVAEPVVYAERRVRGWLHETLLFTVTVPGAAPIDAHDAPALHALARTLRAAHDAGIELGTPALRDVVVSRADGAPAPTLLDLPRARIRSASLAGSLRARDLARIVVGLQLEGARGGIDAFLDAYGPIDRARLEREAARRRAREEERGGAGGLRD